MGSQIMEETLVDLAIIGGGPTGLLTGLLAEKLGVSICIIDSKPTTLDLGRADALNARTQQYLEVVGVLDELLPQGLKCNTSSTFGEGEFKSRQSHWWTGLEYTLHKNFLMIGQPVVEASFASRLKTPVLFNQNVISISEDENGVKTTTDQGRIIRSRYAVAADGAKSTVRKQLGIDFTGTKPEMIWTVLDTFIETDFPVCPEIVTFQLDGQARVSWIPRERNMARFYTLLPQDGDYSQERTETSIRAHMAPRKVEFKKTEWFSTFEIKERIASTFVSKNAQGRVILAGDAAHVHSVNGGQGLNTGIADAFALAWRLAAVLKPNKPLTSNAEQDLIRSYDIERRTVAQCVIDVAARLVRDTVRTAKEYVATIERNAGYITGMGVAYDGMGSPLVHGSELGIWTAGRRCPDIYLQCGETSKRIYSLAKYGRFLVLLCGSSYQGLETRSYEDIADCLNVVPASNSKEDNRVFSAKFLTEGDEYVVVVRPDMYIGYSGSDEGWRSYLSRIFQ